MQFIKSPFTSDHEGRKIAAAVVLLLITVSPLSMSDVFEFLGTSVAISGSTVVVGAQSSGNINQGSVHVFKP